MPLSPENAVDSKPGIEAIPTHKHDVVDIVKKNCLEEYRARLGNPKPPAIVVESIWLSPQNPATTHCPRSGCSNVVSVDRRGDDRGLAEGTCKYRLNNVAIQSDSRQNMDAHRLEPWEVHSTEAAHYLGCHRLN